MRTITLNLNDEQFVSLYSMAESLLATSKTADEAIMEIFRQIHDECEPQANGIERDAVRTVARQLKEFTNADSPDLYLMKAGFNGMIENLFNKNS